MVAVELDISLILGEIDQRFDRTSKHAMYFIIKTINLVANCVFKF